MIFARIIFNTWMKILCSQCLLEGLNPWTSINPEFHPLRCSTRPLLHLPSVAVNPNPNHNLVNPLYLHPWRRLLVVDFEDVTPSWILWSSTTAVVCALPGLLVLLNSPVHSFFLSMYQFLNLASPKVSIIFLKGSSFFSASWCLLCLHQRLFGIKRSHEKLLNTK